MKVRDKRILKNGTVAGYVYYPKEKKWKWRFLPSTMTGGRKKKKFKGKKNSRIKIYKKFL
jgi:phage pi2 protein 07